jgi:DNA replication initiation complex subunit (GINS family)
MADEEAITFEFIRKVHREEQYSNSLSSLPEDFYRRAEEYLKQKTALMQKRPDKGIAIELSNVERLLEDIYNRRESKIARAAMIAVRTEIPPENLTAVEENLFKDILDILKSHRRKTLSLLLGKTKEESDFVELKFTGEVPEFVGADARKYGPFKKGDTVEVPPENAELLVKNRLAKKV